MLQRENIIWVIYERRAMETLKEEVNSKNNALKKNKDNKEKNQEENKNSEINIKNIRRNVDLKKRNH